MSVINMHVRPLSSSLQKRASAFSSGYSTTLNPVPSPPRTLGLSGVMCCILQIDQENNSLS